MVDTGASPSEPGPRPARWRADTANPRVAVYVLAAGGAILVSVGIGMRFGVAWACIALGVALVAAAVTLVDVGPRLATPIAPVAAVDPPPRIPRPGPRPPTFPARTADGATDDPSARR